MKNERILNLAYEAALQRWEKAQEKLENNPDSDRTKFNEKIAWEELREIEKILEK